MGINVTARIRNSMIALALCLCAVFTGLIFLLVYVIEDQVFVNQVKLAQSQFGEVVRYGDVEQIERWQPSSATMRRISSEVDLPDTLPNKLRKRIVEQAGVHEYFDDQNALFIARLSAPQFEQAGYLVYDVSDLLAVRGTKLTLFILIGIVSLFITVVAILFARRLTRSTLAPVTRLSKALKNSDLDDVVIDMAKEFSDDEISVLTQELATSIEAVQKTAKREFEFNRGISHELRSPIQVAKSASELLHLASAQNGSMTKPVARLQRSIEEMNEIAEAFLWLSSPRDLLADEGVSLKQLQLLTDNIKDILPNHTVAVTLSLRDDQRIPLPENVLSVMLRNLVRNAALHGSGERISIEAGHQFVCVRNELGEISEARTGFGIGLSIVAGLCERFGCELRAAPTKNQYQAKIEFPFAKD